jgi:DNA mismatch repair protein MutL
MTSNGTNIAVKNLFFNIPARRNFLGKNTTEYRKVLEEFLRIALVHPTIEMSFHHNDDEIYNLTSQGLRQRIVQIYGANFNQRLVPVNEETDIIKIKGFVVKPEYAKASKDQAFFFVNNRFFKDRYFNHAVLNAYEGLIPSGKYPPYFLYFDVPTESIDVNVHPTKTEIKFEENQAIYAIIRSAVKQALGQFNIAPTLDFEQETSFNIPALKKGEAVKMPEIKVDPNFNPFKSTQPSRAMTEKSTGLTGAVSSSGFSKIQPSRADWEEFYDDSKEIENHLSVETATQTVEVSEKTIPSAMNSDLNAVWKKPTQINDKYILTSIKNGFILIDQYRAHCRILFDQFISSKSMIQSQQLLFAEELTIDRNEIYTWSELLPELNKTGFELSLSENKIIISAVPTELKNGNPKKVLTELFERYNETSQTLDLDLSGKIALAMASSLATKGGNKLTVEEMQYLTDALFASSAPQVSPHGKKIIETFTLDEITKRFN